MQGFSNTGNFSRLKTLGMVFGLALFSISSLEAREPLYGAHDHEALLECEALYWSGQRTLATDCYRRLLSPGIAAEIQAEAMWALGDLQAANRLFQTAYNNSAENALVRIRWAELFTRSYQYQDAYELFLEALELEPDNAYAHVGLATTLIESGTSEGVDEHMEAVTGHFASPPGARFRVMLMSVHSAMEQDEYDEAREALDGAWGLARSENLPTMKLHAFEAALAFLNRENPQPHIDAALAENPAYGDAYAIPGYFASITRRYREAGRFYQQAVLVEPTHWNAHLELGQTHLRLNRIDEGVHHIQTAYGGDAFNPKTLNLMRLLDTFTERFVELNYPDPPSGDGLPELILRLHEDEKDVLKDYALQLAEESIASFSERYRFEPREPIVIEIFPNHEDFVVRSIGMPGIGILGVAFGYLFAMDSPSGHPEESYHWGTTLWHEMAHVFTLEASQSGVPRWFSEGVSVYEEWNTGPTPGIKIPIDVLQAMAEGRFLPIAELDDGFMRPSYENQVMVSYMQAGLVFQFISQEYGHDKIVEMLYDFVDGSTHIEALESRLGISERDFDRHFSQYIDIEFGPLLSNLNTWISDQQTAIRAYQAENWEEAVAASDRAIFTYPDYVEADSPYIIKARALNRLNRLDEKLDALERYWQLGGHSPNALNELADDYLRLDRKQDAIEVLMAINWADPFSQSLHSKLGELYLETGEPALALREFLVGLALKPLDQAAANFRVALAYHALNEPEQGMNYLMTALDIAPQYRPAQQLLLDMLSTTDD